MLTQGSFSCPFVLHVWNRSFASANKIKSLKRVQKRAPPSAILPTPSTRTASTVAGCVSFILGLSLGHRLESKPVFQIRAPLPGQHFDSSVYEIISLPILTTNSRAGVGEVLIGCSLLLGGTGPVPLLLSSLQTTAGDGRRGRAAHLLEGARTLTGFIGKKPKPSLKESQDFQARRHPKEHQMQPLDFMDEGGSETHVTSKVKELVSSVEEQSQRQQQNSSVFCFSFSGLLGTAHVSVGESDNKRNPEIREQVLVPGATKRDLPGILSRTILEGLRNVFSGCW